MDSLSPITSEFQRPTEAALRKLALRCVSELTRSHRIEHGPAREEFLDMLIRHAMTGERGVLTEFYDAIRRAGVSAEQVVDIYLAAAIGRIGTAWHESEIDILQASIAVSRLQALLRELGDAWFADRTCGAVGQCVLLVLPMGEQHCFGTMVAANQLRRMGVSVKISLAIDSQKLVKTLRERRYEAVFVSSANRSSLASCAELVNTIRQNFGRRLNVVCGGGIVAEMGQQMSSRALAERLGADLATADISEALAFIADHGGQVAAE